ncbi:MAG: hypothetical protein JXR97_05320 [Planctomycetes bacterium]|nr:hypothetical protein [Planctomycetota bacterium]
MIPTALAKEFKSPGSQYRGKPFWAWNGKLEPEELRRQIRIMHRMGLGGFFMHSRVGLDTAYLSDDWFKCVDACIDEAEKLGMEAWLYDEDRWPSGAAGGLVTKNPDYRMCTISLLELDNTAKFKWDKDVVAAFIGKIKDNTVSGLNRVAKGKVPAKLGSGEKLLVFKVMLQENNDWYNGYTYLDTMNHDAVKEFIKVTHEAYRKRCGKYFGKTIPGIFTDEPNYGHAHNPNFERDNAGFGGKCTMTLQWTKKLPEVFKKRYGYDITDHLPEVFLDVDGKTVQQARWHFFDCITWLFVDAFARQIGEWCDKNGMMHTGHVLEELTLSGQTNVVGSAMRFYEYMQAPGMDILTQVWREYDTAKQVSSAAHQFGQKWRLTETYGCTGWDFNFTGHKAIGDWQAALGINLRCQHLSWYTMEGEAKRDYPACIFYQSPWWEMYSKVEDYFARVHAVMTKGEEIRDLLFVHPVESMWLYKRKGWHEEKERLPLDSMMVDMRDCLLGANIDYDYGDEYILSRHAKVVKGKNGAVLKLGKASYKTVLVPPAVTIRQTTLDLLDEFVKAGGKVIFAGKVPAYVDALKSDNAKTLAGKCVKTKEGGAELISAVEGCRRVSVCDGSGKEINPTLYGLREDKEAYYLFLINTGSVHTRLKNQPVTREVRVEQRTCEFDSVKVSLFEKTEGKPLELDLDSGDILEVEAESGSRGWSVKTSLPKIGSRMFIFPKKKTTGKATAKPLCGKTVKTTGLGRSGWDYRLSERNNLVLDCPKYSIGGGALKKENEILQVDFAVREALGIKHRGGHMVQPWARDKNRKFSSVPVVLEYSFGVDEIPSGGMHVALERPDTFKIFVNGRQLSNDAECGWWVDKSLRLIPFDSSLLKKGENALRLECEYAENHPGLEIVYLLGDFGTKVSGRNVSICGLPAKIKIGDWVKQGLSFYSGHVSYVKKVKVAKSSGERVFVRVPSYNGVGVKVYVDGIDAGIIGWEPNELEITELVTGSEVELAVQVIGHRRNSHGPFHLECEKPDWVGPAQFGYETAEYKLVECGLMKEPEIVVKK